MKPNVVASSTPEIEENLKKECERVRSLLADATRDDLLARHECGCIALQVKNDTARYGERAVKRLAAELGQDKSTLYKAAKVAIIFDRVAVEHMSGKRNKYGQPLSWNHLVLCAYAPKDVALDLAERALGESLSVKELKTIVAGMRELKSSSTATASLRADLQRFATGLHGRRPAGAPREHEEGRAPHAHARPARLDLDPAPRWRPRGVS